jgi:F-type H+-transporting ATPase subunit alpha
VKSFEKEYIDIMKLKHAAVMSELAAGKLTDEGTAAMEQLCKELTAKYA